MSCHIKWNQVEVVFLDSIGFLMLSSPSFGWRDKEIRSI